METVLELTLHNVVFDNKVVRIKNPKSNLTLAAIAPVVDALIAAKMQMSTTSSVIDPVTGLRSARYATTTYTDINE